MIDHTHLRKFAALGALVVGMDVARGPDRTAYWSPPHIPKVPSTKKRAKIKAARKQRNRK
jgi:hypothetical protein